MPFVSISQLELVCPLLCMYHMICDIQTELFHAGRWTGAGVIYVH